MGQTDRRTGRGIAKYLSTGGAYWHNNLTSTKTPTRADVRDGTFWRKVCWGANVESRRMPGRIGWCSGAVRTYTSFISVGRYTIRV